MIMNNQLIELERKAIRFIRNAERLALRMDERGFHVAFSGGKDSQVLLALVEMAGVKHHAEMQVTTVDSPNLMKFVRTYYPQVHLNLPQAEYAATYLEKEDAADTPSKVLLRLPERTSRGRVLHLYGHSPLRINQKGETASCGAFRQPQWMGNTR